MMNEDRTRTALALEERQLAEGADRLASEVQQKGLQFRSRATVFGHGPSSTALWAELVRCELDRLYEVVETAAVIRRGLCKTVPELGSADQLAVWSQRLHGWLDAELSTLHTRVGNLVGGVQYEQEVRKFIIDRAEWSRRFAILQGQVARKAEMIAGEVKLGIHTQVKPEFTVHISGSIGALNLGSIQGDMNTAIGSLVQETGGEQVARGLKRLAEAVGEADELGDQRGEILEGLALITQEAARPPAQRKSQLVRFLLERWHPTLIATAALAEIWTAVHPLLQAWFGIP
jgi:hypothetical protein